MESTPASHSTIFRLTIFLLLAFLLANISAAPVPAPPQISASGHLLMDFDSGSILVSENADRRLEPASLTKIMTAYVVFKELQEGNLSLQDQVLVSEKAWKTPGSRMFIEVNTKVSIDDLIKGMIIQSGNDACVALAEHIAGSEQAFAGLMNEHAARLDMNQTSFVNATGLPHEDHYTTPEDILKVTRATITEFPEFYRLYADKEFTYNDIRQHNRNKLLWRDETVDGVKTGHTEAAGYCLVASAHREGMRLMSVVMGTDSEESRAAETQSLLNFGFRFYKTHKLYDTSDVLKTVRVWKGDADRLQLGLQHPLAITIPRGKYENLNARIRVNTPVEAPVAKGMTLGRVTIELEDEIITDVPLVALEDVAEGGIIDSLMDSLLMMFE